jgi:hypothetical protein
VSFLLSSLPSVGVAALSELISIKPYRSLNGITATAVLSESHVDRVVKTSHPVEQGSTIQDHIYDLPSQVTLEYGYSYLSNLELVLVYQVFLQLKASKLLFAIFTGKRVYLNMTIDELTVFNDHTNENILNIKIVCSETLLATTQVVNVPSSGNMANPDQTSGVTNTGQNSLASAPQYNFTAV